MGKISKFLIAIFILLTIFAFPLDAGTITLDENVFNALVRDARLMEVLSDEVYLYKEAYENSENDFELLTQKHDELVLKYQVLISQYENLDKTYADLDKQNIETIRLQDKKISKLERKNTFNNWLVYSLITGGIAVSINNDKNGAAAGFAGIGLLYYYLNK